jgi:hypothetical protein
MEGMYSDIPVDLVVCPISPGLRMESLSPQLTAMVCMYGAQVMEAQYLPTLKTLSTLAHG